MTPFWALVNPLEGFLSLLVDDVVPEAVLVECVDVVVGEVQPLQQLHVHEGVTG